MKIRVIISLIAAFIISGCQKSESETSNKDASLKKITFIESLKKKGDVTIISSDLILFNEIETNRDQEVSQRGPYQCNITTTIIYRVSDQKALKFSDIFILNSQGEIFKSIKSNLQNQNTDEIDEEIKSAISELDFKIFNSKEFNFISYSNPADSCDLTVMDKNMQTRIISPFFNDYMKNQFK